MSSFEQVYRRNGANGHGIPIYPRTAEPPSPDQMPPHNIEAENSVLGSILLDNKALAMVLDLGLVVPDFFRDVNQIVFQAMLDLSDEGAEIDAITLAHRLEIQGVFDRIGGDETLTEIVDSVPHAANARYYASIVREKSITRRTLEAAQAVASDAQSLQYTAQELLDRAVNHIAGVALEPGDDEIDLPGPWPDPLREAAYQGVVGEILHAIAPHTSADPAAILIQFLTAFSNAIGHGPHWYYEATRHALNLYMCLVGRSSRGGKGTSWDYVKRIIAHLDPDWYPKRLMSGLATGEGLIENVRDPRFERVRIPGEPRLGGGGYELKEVDPGEPDKRALWEETEFDGTLAVASREGNVLSAKLRQLWDSGTAQSATRAKPLRCTEAHVSIVAHVTLRALLATLTGVDVSNGFANRFLWVCVRRTRDLPLGGRFRLESIAGPLERLQQALSFARYTDWSAPLTMSQEAVDLWCKEYPRLSRDRAGVLDDLTSRAEAQVRRIACIYAILDCTTQVQAEHLEAAIAVWDYCEQSTACIFGGHAKADHWEARLIKALGEAPDGLPTTEIRRRVFRSALSMDEAARVLGGLVRTGKIVQVRTKTAGRDRVTWKLSDPAKTPSGDKEPGKKAQ